MIFVEENLTLQVDAWRDNFIDSDGYVVHNYLEAAGLLVLLRTGRSVESVTRPLGSVIIHE